jgi:hypothetical protein
LTSGGAASASAIADMQPTTRAPVRDGLRRRMAESILENRNLTSRGFLPQGATAIHRSENTKTAREENAAFSALKSAIRASLRHHRGTRERWYCVTFFVHSISAPVCASRHSACFYFS